METEILHSSGQDILETNIPPFATPPQKKINPWWIAAASWIIIGFVVTVLIVTGTFASYESRIVGRWVVQDRALPSSSVIVFNEDGTGYSYEWTSNTARSYFMWRIENSELVMIGDNSMSADSQRIRFNSNNEFELFPNEPLFSLHGLRFVFRRYNEQEVVNTGLYGRWRIAVNRYLVVREGGNAVVLEYQGGEPINHQHFRWVRLQGTIHSGTARTDFFDESGGSITLSRDLEEVEFTVSGNELRVVHRNTETRLQRARRP